MTASNIAKNRQSAADVSRERYLSEYSERDDWAIVCSLVSSGGWMLGEQRSLGMEAEFLQHSRAAFTWTVLAEHLDAGGKIAWDVLVRVLDDAIQRERVASAKAKSTQKVSPVLAMRGDAITDLLFYEASYKVDETTAIYLTERCIDKARFRNAQKILRELLQDGATWTGTPEDYIARVQSSVLTLQAKQRESHTHNAGQELHGLLDDMWEKYQSGDPMIGMKTGFGTLDRITRGMEDGDLIIVSAQSGVGKTAFVVNLLVNAAKRGEKVVLFSMEMLFKKILRRMVFMESQIDSDKYFNQQMTDADWVRIQQISGQGWWHNITLVDDASMTLPRIHSMVRQFVYNDGVSLIGVDYTQLLTTGTNEPNREREVAKVSRGLKLIAEEMQLPVVTLSQLNEDGKTRESRGIKNDASHHWIISQSDCQDGLGAMGVEGHLKRYELYIDKGRDSATGKKIPYLYYPAQTRYAEEMQEDMGVH